MWGFLLLPAAIPLITALYFISLAGPLKDPQSSSKHSWVVLTLHLESLLTGRVNLQPSQRSWVLWSRFQVLCSIQVSLNLDQPASLICAWQRVWDSDFFGNRSDPLVAMSLMHVSAMNTVWLCHNTQYLCITKLLGKTPFKLVFN